MDVRHRRNIVFLKDIFLLSFTAIGGPQAHMALFLERLVHKHRYLTDEELVEIQSLCNLLPGPTSTQTITAIGYKFGGMRMAYLTLLVWVLPAVLIMTLAAIGVSHISFGASVQKITRIIQPMALAFMLLAIINMFPVLIKGKLSMAIMLVSATMAYFFPNPYLTPVLIFAGGLVSSFNFHKLEKLDPQPFKIDWTNLFIWSSFLIGSAIIGKLTHWLPIRLFENFYRNGSLTFGGGYVLKPLLYTEFVQFKQYLTSSEFLSGLALAEVVPGPVFSISSYVGALSYRDHGISGQILGSLMATLGIFLPGAFLTFFAVRLWADIKKFRGMRAAIFGVGAVSLGMTMASFASLLKSGFVDYFNLSIILGSVFILKVTKLPSYVLILAGLLAGILF